MGCRGRGRACLPEAWSDREWIGTGTPKVELTASLLGTCGCLRKIKDAADQVREHIDEVKTNVMEISGEVCACEWQICSMHVFVCVCV